MSGGEAVPEVWEAAAWLGGTRSAPLRPAPPPSLLGALWRRAFVPASPARTHAFFFQAAGRRCGGSPSLSGPDAPASQPRPNLPPGDSRGAGPSRRGPGCTWGGSQEPFQTGSSFSLLGFEMTIYHHN